MIVAITSAVVITKPNGRFNLHNDDRRQVTESLEQNKSLWQWRRDSREIVSEDIFKKAWGSFHFWAKNTKVSLQRLIES